MSITINSDCWYEILSHVRDPETLRGTYLTCRMFTYFYASTSYGILIKKKYQNYLIALLYDLQSLDGCDMYELSNNKYLTFEFILDNPDYRWKYRLLSERLCDNPKASDVEIVMKLHSKSWNWFILTEYIPPYFIMEDPNKKWNYAKLSDRYDIPPDFIVEHRCKKWDFNKILDRPDMTWEIAINQLAIIDKYSYLSWPHKICTWDIIMNSNIPHMAWISRNPNIMIDIVLDNPDMQWDWLVLTVNKNMTWKVISENNDNPNVHWHWGNMHANPDITIQTVFDNPGYPWVMNNLPYFKN